jgi:predicted carbohydrate-binding protein with CBM5 and CBM33 domain
VAIPVPAKEGTLQAVATAPAGGAWATGVYCAAHCSNGGVVKELILRWTGSAWKKTDSPSPHSAFLFSITAASATSAWAVGVVGANKTLILHWNGHAWS